MATPSGIELPSWMCVQVSSYHVNTQTSVVNVQPSRAPMGLPFQWSFPIRRHILLNRSAKKIIGVSFRRSLPNTMINIGISHDRRRILPNCLNPFPVFGKRPESLRLQLGTPNPSPFFWTLLDQWIATGALRRWAPLGTVGAGPAVLWWCFLW